ncbi:AMP-binding protein [Paludibacterium purpuratum]|uniref:Long-chain-fatty-acid--CoA ligase n=1 Tax=Paludibacterium purpuratum TaxID=1144873 RepID=A0A4R7B4M2_9NEIS|nr:AMP-binding protein [Paludibacterium purpuratum]TDR77790.1 acyl-coenzyme A synthetase/AMP-(fatty) acid ligase [Paludibacterium purpuratum]
MSSLPLLPATDPQAPFALYRGAVVSRECFQSQVMALAAALPASERVLNLCSDRYWFAVSLFAAIARGIMTVLPNSAAPEHLAAVAAEQPGLLLLGDQDAAPADHLPYFRVDTAASNSAISADLPLIPFDRLVACVYTSGSTGTPKPHYKAFGRLRLGILAGAERIWEAAGGPCSVVGTVPIRHMYGLESSVLLPIFGGGRMSTHIPFFPLDIAASLAEMAAPRLLVITPFHLRKLLEADIALPPVAAVLSATAPLSAELAQDTEVRLGCPVIEIYGSTETGQLATRQPCRETVWHNLGDITLAVRDGETWAQGTVYQTPQMLNDTVELLSPSSFRLVDRKANMVNVAGKRSSLSFLNATLAALPGVEDGVFCIPERHGAQDVERLAAFVVAPTLNRETLLAGLRAHIDPVFLPRPIVFVDSLPRDGNGKILARTLDTLIQQHILDRNTP